MNKNSYRIHDTTIYYRNNTVKAPKGADSWRFKYPHFGTLHRLFNMLRAEGFTIENDAEVAKCIRDDYFIGRHGDLELYAHRYPAGFEIMFFQNIVIENRNGGRYDFDKFQKMPYMIRLRFMKYRDKIIALLKSVEDLKDESKADPRLAEEWIKCRYVESCHHEQKNTDFDLRSLDGQTQEPYNGLDRDKKTIRNGEIKYFRGRNGYLYRGRVYHDLNNMWWVIINKFEVKRVAAFELFDLAPGDKRGRIAPLRIPPEYISRKQAVSQSATKELVAELRKRGLKVKIQ